MNHLNKLKDTTVACWKPNGRRQYTVDTRPTVIRLHVNTPSPKPFYKRNQVSMLNQQPLTLREIWDIPPSEESSHSSEEANALLKKVHDARSCLQCMSGQCCKNSQQNRACDTTCECANALAWTGGDTSIVDTGNSHSKSSSASGVLYNSPEYPNYVKAWNQQPQKCRAEVWKNARKIKDNLPDTGNTGVNFNFMGWSFVDDFRTTQSAYGIGEDFHNSKQTGRSKKSSVASTSSNTSSRFRRK